MGDHSAIQWTDATWNPVLGCEKVSAGCTHCYAIGTARRQEVAFKRPEYQGLTVKPEHGPVNWTGKVVTVPGRLLDPIRWRQPRRIFVNSMSDLFHVDVPNDFIAQVFAVMGLAKWHTYQVLTKRPERMAVLLDSDQFVENAASHLVELAARRGWPCADEWKAWPLPNVWIGTSVEDQKAADLRIPQLLQTLAAVRFLSCEPLLGPVDLTRYIPHVPFESGIGRCQRCAQFIHDPIHKSQDLRSPIDWVIAGGESGAKHRPFNPDWARSLRDQCQAAGVAFFFKQHGGRTHNAGGRELDGRTWDEFPNTQGVAS